MDLDKLKQWLELAQKYQSGDFWGSLMEQPSFSQFLKDDMVSNSPFPSGPNQSNQNQSGPQPAPAPDSNFPNIDIYITDVDVIVLAELAGYRKEDLYISVSGNKLLLKGNSVPIVTGKPIVLERKQGQFERIIDLPESTDSNEIRARFQNGILFISYPRRHFPEESIIIE